MSSRQRPRQQPKKPSVPADQVQRDLERFAASLKASENAERAARERERVQRDADAALTEARRALESAVEGVRAAKRSGRGVGEADAAWRAAKARVIELETGAAPSWAPRAAIDEPAVEDQPSEPDAETASETEADGS
jgi:hypothetical protein